MQASPTVKTTYIEGGNYTLSSTLQLIAADSGESWLAMPGQTPIINGGLVVTGWVQGANGLWTAPAPAGSIGSGGAALTDLFLYVNGVRLTPARYPNYNPANPVQGGWLTAAASLPGENGATSFQFNPGDIPTFANTNSLYASVYQQNGWHSYSVPVASINYTTDTITLATPVGSSAAQGVGGLIGLGSRYYIYNAANLLDTPGEWYADTTTNTLNLIAPAGFDGTGVAIGTLHTVIGVSNASNVTIAGLTIQSSAPDGNGIRADASSGLVLAGNTISDVGNGIQLSGSATSTDVEGNLIKNTDDYGVLIDPGINNVTIKGNTIQNTGQLLNGDGIWFTGSSNDLIEHNLVQNTAHTGIGGSSSSTVQSSNNTIRYNQVALSNQASSDGGGIYLADPGLNSSGNVISDNYVIGVTAVGTAVSPTLTFLSPVQLVGYGIYLDDYASGVTVHGNLLDNNVDGVEIHGGSNNTISDNIIANTPGNAVQNAPSVYLNLTSVSPTGNVIGGNLIVNGTSSLTLADNLGNPSNGAWSGNFYATSGLFNTSFVTYTNGVYKATNLAGWQAQGFDVTGLSGTPGFVPGSFTLAAGSAAAAAGITSPAYSQFGLTGFVPTNAYDIVKSS